MKVASWVAVALAACVLAVVDAQPLLSLSSLNSWIANKQIGEVPGPCPTYGSCETDVTELPDYLAIASVTLQFRVEFCVNLGFLGRPCIGFNLGPYTDNLATCCGGNQGWAAAGDGSVWNVRSRNINVGSMILARQTRNNFQQQFRLTVDNIDTNVRIPYQLRNFVLGTQSVRNAARRTIDGIWPCTWFNCPNPVPSSINLGTTSGSPVANLAGNNIDFILQLRLLPRSGFSFANDLPYRIEYYGSLPSQCQFNFASSGISFEGNQVGYNIPLLNSNSEANLVSTAVKAFISATFCAVALNMDYIRDINGNPTSTLGPLNTNLNQVYNDIHFYVDQGTIGSSQIISDETTLKSTSLYLDNDDVVMDFQTDPNFDFFDKTINDFLGAESELVPNTIVLNELIGRLLENQNGIFDAPNSLQPFPSISPLDRETLTYRFELSAFEIEFFLKSFTLTGLNTFKSNFQLLDQFGSLTTTLTNVLELASAGFEADFDITISSGVWMKPSSNPTITRSFSIDVSATDVTFDADLSTLFNYRELLDKYVGHLVDYTNVEDAINCTLQTVYYAQLPSFQVSISNVQFPAINVAFDLRAFFQGLLGVTFDSLQGFLETQMPAIGDRYFRSIINEYFQNYLDDLPSQCWNFVPNYNTINPINFETNVVAKEVNKFINRTVGGEIIQISDVDLNTVLDFYAQEYQSTLESFFGSDVTLVRVTEGDWNFLKDGSPLIVRFESLDTLSFVSFSNVRLRGLNSISSFLVEPAQSNQERFKAVIGTGNVRNPGGSLVPVRDVSLLFEVSALSCRNNICAGPGSEVLADDTFEFKLDFNFAVDAILQADVNYDKVMGLFFEDLNYPVCILATFDSYNFERLDLETTKFLTGISSLRVGGPSDFSDSRFGRALLDLQGVLLTAGPHQIATFQVRYILRRIVDYFKEVIVASAQQNDINVPTCKTADFELDTSAIDGLFNFSLPDTGGVFDDQPIIRNWPFAYNDANFREMPWEELEGQIDIPEGSEPFDIRGNSIVENLRSFANTEGLADPIRVLANSSFFNTFMVLNDDGTVDLDLDLGAILLDFELDIVRDLLGIPDAEEFVVGDFAITLGRFKMNQIEQASFSLFRTYEPEARFTTKHLASFSYPLNATLNLTISTDGEFVGDPPGTTVSEEIMIEFQVTDLELDMVTLLAVDLELLQELQLDTFFEVDVDQTFLLRPDFQSCLFKPIFENGVRLPGFQATYKELRSATIYPVIETSASKLFTTEFAEFVGATLDVLAETYKDEFADFTQGYVRETLENQLLDTLRKARDGAICPLGQSPPAGMPRLYNFVESTQVFDFYNFVENDLQDEESPFYINTLLSAYLANGFGDTLVQINNFPLSYNQRSFGSFSFGITDFSITGLESIDELMLFDFRPTLGQYPDFPDDQPYIHRSIISTGRDDTEVVLSFKLLVEADGLFIPREGMLENEFGEETIVRDELDIEFRFSRLRLQFDAMTKLIIEDFLKLKVEAFFDLGQYPCFLEAFEDQGLRILAFDFSLGDVRATLTCSGDCNSPQLEFLADATVAENEELNEAITETLNSTVELLNIYIQSEDFYETISDEITFSTYNCIRLDNPIDTETINETPVAQYMGIVGLAALFAGGVSIAFLIPVHIRRQDEVMKAALLKIAASGGMEKGALTSPAFLYAEQRMRSIFRHPATTRIAKYGLPFWILWNFIFLITANFFAIGASVQLKMQLLGDTTQPLDLVTFTLESSINDMWNSGAYVLALAIAIASCAWPYLKNILMLFCWFAPTTVLNTKRRGTFLEVLDMLGKWSLVDVYILIMLIVGFRFYITSSYVGGLDAYLPADVLVLDIVVTPGWGIYGFVLGAMGSLIVNHFMIFYHRRAVRLDEQLEDMMNGAYVPETPTTRQAISKHRFGSADKNGRIYGFSPAARLMVGASLTISFFLILIGSVVDLITFEFRGIAGFAINLINSELASVTYSLASVANAIVEGANPDPLNRTGILFLQIIYLMFGLIVPLILILTVALLWYYPMRAADQRNILFVAEILAAWEALLVFLLSIIAAILQISQLAQFVVANSTGTLCANLENFLLDRAVAESDAQCFDVIASLELTGVILIMGSVVLIFSTIFIFRMLNAVVSDRIAMNKRKECTNPHAYPRKSFRGFVLKRTTIPVARLMMRENSSSSFGNMDDDPARPPFVDDQDESRLATNPIFQRDIDV